MTKEEALKILKDVRRIGFTRSTYFVDEYHTARNMAIEALERESETGIWIYWTDDRKDYLKCSICGYGEEGEVNYATFTPYCPMCGAKMIEP